MSSWIPKLLGLGSLVLSVGSWFALKKECNNILETESVEDSEIETTFTEVEEEEDE